jgi:ribonuclease P protein component
MSLPRARILRNHRQFARVRAEGNAKVGRFLLVTAVPAPETEAEGATLFGFVTPKYVGKAHDRNLVRRRLKAIAAACAPDLRHGFHVVTLARRTVGQADFAALEKEWRRLAGKAGLVRKGNPSPGGAPPC